jgi:ribose transport system substrate-binding protein
MFARFLSAAAVVSSLCLAGCSGSNSAGGGGGSLKVAFVSNNAFEFWTYARRGTEKAAKELGVECEFKMPSQGTAEEQRQIIDDLMAKGIKALAISPKDAANQQVYLDEIAARIPLITQDSDLPPGSKRRCYIGTNNYEAGKSAGKLVREAMPDGGKVIVFVGSLDVKNAQERRQGVLDELAGATNATGPQLGKYELLGTKTDEAKPDVCKANAEDELAKYQGDPEKLALVGLWAYNPPAMLNAVKGKKLEGKIKVIGFDEDIATLEGIEDGFIIGTIVQQPFEFGYRAVKLMTALARGESPSIPADGIVFVPHETIRRDNVAAFRDKLEQLRKPAAN